METTLEPKTLTPRLDGTQTLDARKLQLRLPVPLPTPMQGHLPGFRRCRAYKGVRMCQSLDARPHLCVAQVTPLHWCEAIQGRWHMPLKPLRSCRLCFLHLCPGRQSSRPSLSIHTWHSTNLGKATSKMTDDVTEALGAHQRNEVAGWDGTTSSAADVASNCHVLPSRSSL